MLQTKKEIQQWLIDMKINNYVIHDDLTVDVYDNINLIDKKLNKIPIKFGVINGYFNCSYNYLTSLENFPQEINGGFIYDSNPLPEDLLNLLESIKINCIIFSVIKGNDAIKIINSYYLKKELNTQLNNNKIEKKLNKI